MPSKAIGAPRVTVPAVPWNTAKPPRQGALTLPSTAVQLVVAVFQVALPPSTAPLPSVLGPSQNSSPKLLDGLMIRLTSPGGGGRDQHLVGEEPARQARQHQAVVGERAAVVDDPVDAAAEPAGIGEVERAVEGQRAGDDGEVVDVAADDVGQRELVVELRACARARARRRSACRRCARGRGARRRPRSPCRRSCRCRRGARRSRPWRRRRSSRRPAAGRRRRWWRRCNRSPRSAWSCRCPAGPPRHCRRSPRRTPARSSDRTPACRRWRRRPRCCPLVPPSPSRSVPAAIVVPPV